MPVPVFHGARPILGYRLGDFAYLTDCSRIPDESWPLLERLDLKLDAFDLIEINEAFAAQVLADGNALGFDWDRVNVNGGAVALGHPLGCTGAKLTATIIRELQRRNGRYGMVTMCVGGGMGAAGIFENIQ